MSNPVTNRDFFSHFNGYIRPGIDGLLDIMSTARPHDSVMEQWFCTELLDAIPGMQKDDFGNRWLIVGDRSDVMWSSHVDTVASRGGYQEVEAYFEKDTYMARLKVQKPGRSLGADCGTGVWIMLNMIAASRPGLYMFHRGEELGCLGSNHIRKHGAALLAGIKIALAFDRKGDFEIITHQMGYRSASQAFAISLADELERCGLPGYEPSDRGAFTDTEVYTDIIPECSNIGVGYEGNHGPRETQDLDHAWALLSAMLDVEIDALVSARDPQEIDSENEYDLAWGRGVKSFAGGAPMTEEEELAELVYRYPDEVAALLMGLGYALDDMREFLSTMNLH